MEASGDKLTGVTAMGPFPIDWPEQEVRLLMKKLRQAQLSQHVFPDNER